MPSHSENPPPKLSRNPESGEWDFEPFVAWLKEQGVFRAFDANHIFGPNAKNHATVRVVNEQKFADDPLEYRLPAFAGDVISILPAGSKEDPHLIKTVKLPDKDESNRYGALIFASFSGMLEKVLNPEVMKPYLEHKMLSLEELQKESILRKEDFDWSKNLVENDDPQDDAEFSLTKPREVAAINVSEHQAIVSAFKEHPAMGNAVYQYSSAIMDFVMSLKSAVIASPSLKADEKERGNTLCETIAVNASFYGDPVVLTNLMTAIGLAYVVNHETYKPEKKGKHPRPTREDFQAGMNFLRTNEWFKSGAARCPAEASVLKLSGIVTGLTEDGKHTTTFGNLLFDCFEATQKIIDEKVKPRRHTERVKRTDFGIG